VVIGIMEERKEGEWLGHATSTWAKVEYGVPQGSVFGTFTFPHFCKRLP
jgi:hypothetical protein